MSKPKYLMWFSRFGSPHLVTQDSIEDCYDLDIMLDDAETWFFDQYGCLDCVEHIGQGIIPDDQWEQGLEEYARDQAATPPPTRESATVGAINVQSPPIHNARMWETYRTYSDRDQMQADYSWLREKLGDDRVRMVNHTS